jgi:prolyl-tRNA synthetase
MRYSQLVGKTKKESPKDETSKSAELLIKGGFIHKEIAGAYAFLPLGYKVLNKIIQIIREEMEAIGGQELLLSSLQNPEVWEKCGRWDDNDFDVWFKTKLKSGTELGLAPTHEEPLAQLMKSQISSYKDLPLYVFQFQTKFRNEARAKGGLLRTREFIMKDLYSFDKTEEDLNNFYEKVKEAYIKIFNRAGIGDKTYLTFASGGTFSKYSHEFQTECESGEDVVYLDRKKKVAINREVYTDDVIKDLGLNNKDIEEIKAIEVGNIFKQMTKFSTPLDLTYLDSDGTKKPVVTGAYGIGPARLMATVVELHNDFKGIIWPKNIAPFQVHLVGLNLEESQTKKTADEVYKTLIQKGDDVLFDDRLESTAGVKFSDADLVGIPYRFVVSQKTGGFVEVKKRNEERSEIISLDKALDLIHNSQ